MKNSHFTFILLKKRRIGLELLNHNLRYCAVTILKKMKNRRAYIALFAVNYTHKWSHWNTILYF
jgi:hypothetical protein